MRCMYVVESRKRINIGRPTYTLEIDPQQSFEWLSGLQCLDGEYYIWWQMM